MSEQEIAKMGDWVFMTCRLFGTSLDTAYFVAGEFVRGLLIHFGFDHNVARRI